MDVDAMFSCTQARLDEVSYNIRDIARKYSSLHRWFLTFFGLFVSNSFSGGTLSNQKTVLSVSKLFYSVSLNAPEHWISPFFKKVFSYIFENFLKLFCFFQTSFRKFEKNDSRCQKTFLNESDEIQFLVFNLSIFTSAGSTNLCLKYFGSANYYRTISKYNFRIVRTLKTLRVNWFVFAGNFCMPITQPSSMSFALNVSKIRDIDLGKVTGVENLLSSWTGWAC